MTTSAPSRIQFQVARHPCIRLFFFNDTATTEIYTLSLHDALPISARRREGLHGGHAQRGDRARPHHPDRKSTRLNSSHQLISYAVFCLKIKKMNFVSKNTISHYSIIHPPEICKNSP